MLPNILNAPKWEPALPYKLINAIACLLEDVAESVKIFGITRKGMPYASYINHAGRLVSSFLKREILGKLRGTHIGFKAGNTIYTDLATGEQTTVRFGYGDVVEIIGDRHGIDLIWRNGKVFDAYSDGSVSVQVASKIYQFQYDDLALIEKAPEKKKSAPLTKDAFSSVANWTPYKGVTARSWELQRQRDEEYRKKVDHWASQPDEAVFAAEVEARKALGV